MAYEEETSYMQLVCTVGRESNASDAVLFSSPSDVMTTLLHCLHLSPCDVDGAAISGSFALWHYLTRVEGKQPTWTPHDVDVVYAGKTVDDFLSSHFIPFMSRAAEHGLNLSIQSDDSHHGEMLSPLMVHDYADSDATCVGVYPESLAVALMIDVALTLTSAGISSLSLICCPYFADTLSLVSRMDINISAVRLTADVVSNCWTFRVSRGVMEDIGKREMEVTYRVNYPGDNSFQTWERCKKYESRGFSVNKRIYQKLQSIWHIGVRSLVMCASSVKLPVCN
jgi:hypothetical protein